MTTQQIAQTILDQLGGRRFAAMTGARNLIALDASEGEPANDEHGIPAVHPRVGGLCFQIGRFSGVKTTHVRISLTPDDEYDMEFLAIRGTKIKTIREVRGVYCDQIEEIFRDATGLETRMPTVLFR